MYIFAIFLLDEIFNGIIDSSPVYFMSTRRLLPAIQHTNNKQTDTVGSTVTQPDLNQRERDKDKGQREGGNEKGRDNGGTKRRGRTEEQEREGEEEKANM